LAIKHVERRLAAVVAADVAGYSRLMGNDEERTLAALKNVRATLVDPVIADHRGRIVKTSGDGMLVEFASAVDAARCAVEVQRGMAAENASVPRDLRIEFRIGIHVGDIIIDDTIFFGDGVNIAARLEGMAEPGGICISDDAHRQIRARSISTSADLGSQALKNIAERCASGRSGLPASPRLCRPRYVAPDGRQNSGTAAQPASTAARQAVDRGTAVRQHERDREQEYFADGMVEEIITALSRFKSLFVIARNSSFAYKGRAVDIKLVGRELGVRYVLEGQRPQGRVKRFGSPVS